MTQGELGEKATEPDQAILEKSTSATRTGRPPKHDWDAFWIEVAHFAAKNDLMPEDRAELQQHMERWAVGAAPNDPMDSTTIRRKLQSLFARRAPK